MANGELKGKERTAMGIIKGRCASPLDLSECGARAEDSDAS
jgi:hypothetical protein